MIYLEINNCLLGKYTLNITLETNTSYAVYSRYTPYISRFLYLLTGITEINGSILYNDKTIFDNEEYFKNRIFLDFQENYLRTLNSDFLLKALKLRYGTEFNKSSFKEAIAQTNIRNEVVITDEYRFTKYGINLGGYCLLKGLKYPNIIIDNPFIHINNPKIKETILKYITNKQVFNTMIIGAYNPKDFLESVDRFIILCDNDQVMTIDPKNDTFIITDDNILLRHKMFTFDHIVICKNDYSKEELKEITKRKQKYRIIKFIDVISYLNEILVGAM